MFQQVQGFESIQVSNNNISCSESNLPTGCKTYYDSNNNQYYNFYYPNDDTVQYLYETYPENISPLDGVTDEHFIVWMRTEILPTFRKLYGKIKGPFKSGDIISFNIISNFEVTSYRGTKSLLLTNLGSLGSKNTYIGKLYTAFGTLFLLIGIFTSFWEYFSIASFVKSTLNTT